MAKKIMIIDDNEDILEALETVFQLSGYMVYALTDGTDAYTLAHDYMPDVIVLDMLLAGANGLTVCNSLKMSDRTKQIPIIMISAHPGATKLTQAAGADYFVPKPFEIDELVNLAEKVTTPSN